METTTVTLNAVTLPDDCNAVFLLDDRTLGSDVTATYEASLDGGTTWAEVTPGELNELGHVGDSFKLRCTLARPDEAEEPDGEGTVFWFIGYATSTGSE